MIKHYWESMIENTAPFMLAWEAYVFFMLCFFISIVIRLNRIENKINKIVEEYRELLDYIYEEEERKWDK
jgi:TM2 domain-containing membrane protein YozV|tara:strand:+ start:164 stop:373 length:210 start_codon:yes stop_codon:yes gene_type:complete